MHLPEQAAIFLLAAVLLSASLTGNVEQVQAAEVKAVPAQARFSRGLLWRVSKRGVAASHIFGTIHVADPRVLLIPDAVMQALSKSRSYAMEIQLNPAVEARFPLMAGHYRTLTRHIVDQRSVVMAHRLFMPLREGRVFVAIGVDHLYGEKGVLRLLQKQGYRVTRVY